MRASPLLLAFAVAIATGCQKPPGNCGTHADCRAGQECASGVCIRLVTDHQVDSRCVRDSDCVEWAGCVGGKCVVDPGRCDTAAECQAWEACPADTHVCALGPGKCVQESDCPAWKSCSGHDCVLDAGMCDVQADCASWEYCIDPEHACTDVGGACTADGDCNAWETCDTGHCANQPGRCSLDAQCDPLWQLCDESHTCAVAPGHCENSVECDAWQTCSAGTHVCITAPTCSSAAQCAGGDECVDGYCAATYSNPGEIVWLYGAVSEWACGQEALSPVLAPTRVQVGFDCDASDLVMSPGGKLYYSEPNLITTGDSIREFNPDPWVWDTTSARWTYPSDVLGNDPKVATPACDSGVTHWIMQQTTGKIAHCCYGTRDWYDSAGNLVFSGVVPLSWNANGYALAEGPTGTLQVLKPDGTSVTLTAVLYPTQVVSARAHGDGFWVVYSGSYSGPYSRWLVNTSGAATLEGTYSAESEVSNLAGVYFQRIGGDGAIWGTSYKATATVQVVVRCRIAPGGCAVVYDEENAVQANYEVYPPRVYNIIQRYPLVTGP